MNHSNEGLKFQTLVSNSFHGAKVAIYPIDLVVDNLFSVIGSSLQNKKVLTIDSKLCASQEPITCASVSFV